MAQSQRPIIVLGAGSVGDSTVSSFAKYDTPEEVKAFLDTFYEHGGRHLDTARNYAPGAPGSSEPRLGAANAGSRFSIDTKVLGFPGDGPFYTAQQIKESIDVSVAELKLPEGTKIDTMYLHIPDRETPFEETCGAINEAYQQGKFKRFGISNYTADEVEKIVAICKEKGFIAPSVYQGQYNPLVRSGEDILFPVLRRHNIAFYAYSPAAVGVFVGNQKTAKSGSRFDSSQRVGQIYAANYGKPKITIAADHAREAAAKHNINGHAAALRWTTFHSKLDGAKGDAVIVGASSVAQLASNLDIIDQGPLPRELADVYDGVYGQLGDEAISYHM
ncbi:aflatoxin B1 aldehyde reductase member 2 [Diaporthe helianthi]|uniref:Aflatoxin B1 aldehyde reductase member 2 n=1 Tax=Diaporthe helianthi TaxID=158607 RepID=A0A2P5HMZ2_DIAHE|nr:aflatoxin B1 aldehyde reductase member 2 [Diaporthe helianthi]